MKKTYLAAIIIVLVVIVAAIGAYALMNDSEADTPKVDEDTPKVDEDGVYYVYIAMDDGTKMEQIPDGWIKCTGDNALVAITSTFSENNWEYEAGSDFLSSLFGYDMVQDTENPTVYSYWVVYIWDDALNKPVQSQVLLPGIVSEGSNSPEYVFLIYKALDYTSTEDTPPDVSPEDVPESLL